MMSLSRRVSIERVALSCGSTLRAKYVPTATLPWREWSLVGADIEHGERGFGRDQQLPADDQVAECKQEAHRPETYLVELRRLVRYPRQVPGQYRGHRVHVAECRCE